MIPFLTPAQQTSFFLLAGALLVIALLFFSVRGVRRARGANAIRRAVEPGGDLPAPWRSLRREVEMANRAFNRDVFFATQRLFLDYYADGRVTPAALTREYPQDPTQDEFLLVLDEQGRPAKPLKEVSDRFYKVAGEHAEFKRWFRESMLLEGELAGSPVLLAARWLCHLTGLRHGTVEIFLDPPDMPGHTLVQVRAMSKFEAPGAFDIPCAGHIRGMEAPVIALEKELREELNIRLEDLDDIQLLGRYNSYTGIEGDAERAPLNNEHRFLYRAKLKPETAKNIRFSDGEVAGLSVFAVSELRALVQQYPERVASGLADAIGFYE